MSSNPNNNQYYVQKPKELRLYTSEDHYQEDKLPNAAPPNHPHDENQLCNQNNQQPNQSQFIQSDNQPVNPQQLSQINQPLNAPTNQPQYNEPVNQPPFSAPIYQPPFSAPINQYSQPISQINQQPFSAPINQPGQYNPVSQSLSAPINQPQYNEPVNQPYYYSESDSKKILNHAIDMFSNSKENAKNYINQYIQCIFIIINL